jgi:magnesium transporter
VDAYASWTLFFIFVSISILISGVVLLTHKKPESTSAQHESGIALNAVSGRQIPRTTTDGKTDGEDQGQVMWDVGEASDEEDETPRPQGLAEASHGEEGERLMAASHDDGEDILVATDRRPPARRRSTSSVLGRDHRDDRDEFGDFAGS